MKNKIIGIFVCMLLILSVYTVSASNIRTKENKVIVEVGDEEGLDFVLIPYVHHMYYLAAYRLNSSQMFLCMGGIFHHIVNINRFSRP